MVTYTNTKNRKYRGKHLIIAAILEAAQTGVTRTKIMYDSYVSYYQCDRYLKELELDGLLEREDEEAKYFRTTDAGQRWLSLYRQMESLTIQVITT